MQGCGFQIAGLNPDMKPSGRWYDLEVCTEKSDGTFSVKVAVTEASKKAGMAGEEADGVQPSFIRRIPVEQEESNVGLDPGLAVSATIKEESELSSFPKIDTDAKEPPEANGYQELHSPEDTTATPTMGIEEVKAPLLQPISNGDTHDTEEKDAPEEEDIKEIKEDSKVTDDLYQLSKEDLIRRLTIAVEEKQAAVRRATKAEGTIRKWEKGVRQILNCIILSPVMNHFYRQKLTKTLESVFLAVDSISNVLYINCSFPSIEAEFPQVELQDWHDLSNSLWKVKWSPSWHITARVEGSHYLSFTLNIEIHKLKVNGMFILSCAKDLSSVAICFPEMPSVSLQIDTTIALGILPIPLSIMQQSIASRVKEAFLGWLKRSLVHPNTMAFPCLRHNSQVTEETMLEEAKAAADLALRGFLK
ncbi:hypothetical protein AAMO2058_000881800 [Amorphochlora amoebiformis]